MESTVLGVCPSCLRSFHDVLAHLNASTSTCRLSLQHQNLPPTNEISIELEENELDPGIEQDNNADDDKGYGSMDTFDDAAPNDFNKTQQPDASPTHYGSTDNVPDIVEGGFEKIMCPLPTGVQPKAGANMLEAMLKDPLLEKHLAMGHVYYPFADKEEWDVAAWLNNSGLSNQHIDAFLCLLHTRCNPLSFSSAAMLRSCIEDLSVTPPWSEQGLTFPAPYKTKNRLTLYYRDGLEVVKHMASNPIFANVLEWDAYQLYNNSRGTRDRVYTEFMSADFAWKYQMQINSVVTGHSILGIILASDKTPLTVGTGNKEMHPLLISIANIKAGVHMKASSHAFALVGYLPTPKFPDDYPAKVKAALIARLFHFCVNKITKGLQTAATNPVIMSDGHGHLRSVSTPLVLHIADWPEQRIISGVAASASPISLVKATEFGEATGQECRTRTSILQLIQLLCAVHDPWTDLVPFVSASKDHDLLGIHQPYWRDWGVAATVDPAIVGPFTLNPDWAWVIDIIGAKELDYRLSILQRRVGTRSWPNGVLKLKQLMGREHRELEKIIIAIAGNALPTDTMQPICSLLDFIFQAQNLIFYEETILALQHDLAVFHHFKAYIGIAGGHRGAKGPIPHFNIPKLELMHSVAASVRLLGAPHQWTSDVMEHCHITHVKIPYWADNHCDFEKQCVRFLERAEKAHLFGFFARLVESGCSLFNEMVDEAKDMNTHFPEMTWISHCLPDEQVVGAHPIVNYFVRGGHVLSSDDQTALLLNIKPHQSSVPIDTIAAQYNLPDLQASLRDYFSGKSYVERNGKRRSTAICDLPIARFNVWTNLWLQRCSTQDSRVLLPPQTIQALPPSNEMPFGRCNTVIISVVDDDLGYTTSQTGHDIAVVQIHTILQPVAPKGNQPYPPLIYASRFKFSLKYMGDDNSVNVYIPASPIDMFVLEWHRRASPRPGTPGPYMANIFLLGQIEHPVQLVPKLKPNALMDSSLLTPDTSMDACDNFYLNNFWNKENYHAILSYQ